MLLIFSHVKCNRYLWYEFVINESQETFVVVATEILHAVNTPRQPLTFAPNQVIKVCSYALCFDHFEFLFDNYLYLLYRDLTTSLMFFEKGWTEALQLMDEGAKVRLSFNSSHFVFDNLSYVSIYLRQPSGEQ